MKAKNHILLGIFVFILFFGFIIFLDHHVEIIIFHSNFLNIPLMTFGVILYFIGVILPDSDCIEHNSKIYYTPFFILAYFCRIIEFPVSKILKRKVGHRESMHTIVGVLISSLIISILFSLILIYFKSFSFFTIPFLFFMTFFGQIVHLLGDWHWKIV